MTEGNKECLITVIDSLLSLKHQTITLVTVERKNGRFSVLKKGTSPPRFEKFKHGTDNWYEYISAWFLSLEPRKENVLHYVCVRQFPKNALIPLDDQSKQEIRVLNRVLKKLKLIHLNYEKNEDFIELVQEFIDQKELETERLRQSCVNLIK